MRTKRPRSCSVFKQKQLRPNMVNEAESGKKLAIFSKIDFSTREKSQKEVKQEENKHPLWAHSRRGKEGGGLKGKESSRRVGVGVEVGSWFGFLRGP